MDRELILARKRENSRRLRSDPSYRAREAEYSKRYKANPEVKAQKVRIQINYERRLKFGITEDQYEQMKIDQNYRCAICNTDKPGGRGDWHIDHCHTNGNVRGLLCMSCNTALGHFKDDIDILAKAIQYLKTN